MKNRKWCLELLIVSILINTSFALAGQEGHGGSVVKKGTAYYLTDFAEAGVENDAVINQKIIVKENVKKTLLYSFPDSASRPKMDEFRLQLGKKLGEISLTSPILGDVLLEAIKLYSWEFLSFKVPTVKDANLKILAVPLQVAIRNASIIKINSEYFNYLQVSNQVGLIFHELFYAFYTGNFNAQKNSDAIRPLTAEIFKPQFQNPNRLMKVAMITQLLDDAKINLPVYHELSHADDKQDSAWFRIKNWDGWIEFNTNLSYYVGNNNIFSFYDDDYPRDACGLNKIINGSCDYQDICMWVKKDYRPDAKIRLSVLEVSQMKIIPTDEGIIVSRDMRYHRTADPVWDAKGDCVSSIKTNLFKVVTEAVSNLDLIPLP